tara:strand:+ start:4027 stop:5028 length:1002 start_codon:yes stop_codon:yes gene_type:complete
MKKKILLVGGAGYIGTVVTEYLLSKLYNVTCLDSLIYSQKSVIKRFLEKKNYKFVHGDMRNSSLVSELLKEVNDVVILAGLVGDPITKKYSKESKEINHDALMHFINNCNGKNLDKLIFISTCSNYGLMKSEETADEKHRLNPLSSYSEYKVKIEEHILSLKGKIDYCPVILRFATAFGLSPRMRFDLTVNEFVKEIFYEKNLQVYDLDTWRPYCHVNDFANLIEMILRAKKDKIFFEIFNAGSKENNFTKREIVNTIGKFLPIDKIEYKEKGSDRRNYRVNFDKVKNVLNFKAKHNLESGIKELIKYLKLKDYTHFSESSSLFGNYKIFKNE